MITRQPAFVTADGLTFSTLEAAQERELILLLGLSTEECKIATRIMEKKTQVVDILTTTATSKTRARSVNGGKRTRKPIVTAPESTAKAA